MGGIAVTANTQLHNGLGVWNPFDAAYKKDLHAYLHSLRNMPAVNTINGHHFFVDHATVRLLLNHPSAGVVNLSQRLNDKSAFVHEQEKAFLGLIQKTKQWLVHMNPPDHDALRNLLKAVWRQQEFEKAVEDYLAGLVTRMPLGEPFDWIPFAAEMPVYVISKVLGITSTDHSQLRYWSKLATIMQEPFASMYDLAQLDKEFEDFEAYLAAFMAQKIASPAAADLPGRLCMELEKRQWQWSQQDIISFLSQLLIAAIETSAIFLGGALAEVARCPGVWEKVCNDLSTVPLLIEDLLRLTSPLQYTGRIITAPVTLQDGRLLQAGEIVFLSLCGANRDPQVFTHPDQLLLRQPNPHLSLGYGSHYCFGSRLIRFEFNSLFTAFAKKKWRWEMAPQQLEFEKGVSFRQLKKLILIIKERN